jgi:4-hydroxybenzoate polyprenyltransferase
MRIYLGEMFSIPQHALMATLTYLSLALFARWVERQNSPVASWYTLLGAGGIFGLWLILRLMDELKDADIDRELFPGRPVPSGRVYAIDIKRSLAGMIVVYLIAHLAAGQSLWSALLVVGYAFLMFERFFAADVLRRNLILTLVTHNPIIPLMLAHGFVVFAAEHGLSIERLDWGLIIPFIVMLWMPHLGWELARKIRSIEEETAYVTYSRLFGYRGATALAFAVQSIAFGIGFYLWSRLSLSWLYLGILTAGLGLNLFGDLRFALYPSPRTATLKYYAIAFLLCVDAAQIAEFGPLVGAMKN